MTYASLSADLVISPRQREKRQRLREFETGRSLRGGIRTEHSRGRRALVLTDESARHPFRASLPPHVTADLIDIPAERLWDLTREDMRGFASTYVTVTAAVLAFIA